MTLAIVRVLKHDGSRRGKVYEAIIRQKVNTDEPLDAADATDTTQGATAHSFEDLAIDNPRRNLVKVISYIRGDEASS